MQAGSEKTRSFELINGFEERAFWRAVHNRATKSVQRCAANPFRTEKPFAGYYWRAGSELAGLSRSPIVCRTHRCPAESCRKFASNQLYARFLQALQSQTAEGFCFLVLTLPSRWHRPGLPADARYEAMGKARTLFYKRARKWLQETYGEQFESKHIWAVEEHRSGVPHLNLLWHCPALADDLRAEKAGYAAAGMNAKEQIRLRGELLRIAQESGFGKVCTAEGNRSGDEGAEQLAGYLTKTVQGLAGEQQKSTQLPLSSPYRRRTWNAGKGFVPAKHKNSDWTGGVISRRWSRDGDEVAETMLRREIAEPPWLSRARLLPPEHPHRVATEQRWELRRAEQLEYRRRMGVVRSVEQALSYRDETSRALGLPPSDGKSRINFQVLATGEIQDAEGLTLVEAPKEQKVKTDDTRTSRCDDESTRAPSRRQRGYGRCFPAAPAVDKGGAHLSREARVSAPSEPLSQLGFADIRRDD